MKRFLFLACLAVGFMSGGLPAHAQMATYVVNCDELSGTPIMCVKNESPFSIVGIQTSSMATFGQNWIPIRGGQIVPGGTTAVRFPTGWGTDCIKFMVVRTSAGTTHVFPGVDVCHRGSFTIRGW
jgi:hypothetical protein